MAEHHTHHAKKLNIIDLIYISMFAILMALCAWVTIPAVIPFTLQTLGVFCTLGMLGGRRGAISIVIYLLLGIVGIPVFSGFSSGLGVLLGSTGGYLIGFLCTALVYWLVTFLLGDKLWIKILSMLLGLLVCYAFGTAWYMLAYASQTGTAGLMTVLGFCVFPFIIPDLIKMGLALVITQSVQKHVRIK